MTELNEEFDVPSKRAEQYCYSKAWPLPRFTAPHMPSKDQYEVVTSGAGPAGMFREHCPKLLADAGLRLVPNIASSSLQLER